MATVKNIAIGTGRRKTAVARVFLRDGSGKIVVNGKDVAEYFDSEEQVRTVHRP
ncbi:MAG: 30S ribosomal protein S9, partial [Treponemataceae bacterium]|nr:30S ribosomal protein S9 [Treponemataceae bacterium]